MQTRYTIQSWSVPDEEIMREFVLLYETLGDRSKENIDCIRQKYGIGAAINAIHDGFGISK